MDRLILLSESVAEILSRTVDPTNKDFLKLIGAPKLPVDTTEKFEELETWLGIEENYIKLVK